MDPDRILSLARCLRRCRSTPDLSFTAVSLLSKTLTARATRLESTTSRARLEAENEAYKRATIAKRRRALGPKNASDFMRQTIDREKTREINRVKADMRASQLPLQAEPAMRRKRSSDQPPRGASSEIAAALPLRETTHSRHANRSAPTSLGASRTSRAGRAGCDGHERTPTSTQKEQDLTPTLSATPSTDCLNLEDDDDIRALLDRAYSSTSSIRAKTAPRPATSGGGKRSGKMRPECNHPHGRPQARVKSPPARSSPSPSRGKKTMRRPQTAGAGGRIRSLERGKISPSGAVQLRREMLLRSKGAGNDMHLFPAEPFKTTAMGRKTCVVNSESRTEPMPWMPAKTLNGLDRLERSRMLMNQRPVVSPLRLWI